MKPPEETSALTGLILLSSLAVISAALFLQDVQMLVFAIPLIYALIVANSRGKGDIDKNLQSIGVTGSNIKNSIPVGIIAGIVCFIIGNLIISLTTKNVASTVPTFALNMSGASFIPAELFLATNILIQFLIVAPSEELGFRFLAPFIFNSFIKFAPVAMILGTILWVVTHIPTYILQNVPLPMYFVLFLIGLVSIGLIYITKGIIASWIMHSIFNALVLIVGGIINSYTIIILAAIMLSMVLIYLYGGERHAKTQSEFNL